MITHPEKVLFPDDGITKGELAAYYEAIAPSMLPHLRGRPITMERYPSGIGAKGFFQKNVAKGFPEWLERVEVPKKGGTVHHPLVTDVRSLLWLANQNCITPHVWPSRVPRSAASGSLRVRPRSRRRGPRRAASCGARRARSAWRAGAPQLGQDVRLERLSHLRSARARHAAFVTSRASPIALGALLVKRHPDRLTQEFSKADRAGPHSRGHRPQRLQRDVCGGLCRAATKRRAGFGAGYVGGSGERRRRSGDVHVSGRWRSVSPKPAIYGRRCSIAPQSTAAGDGSWPRS